MLLLHGLGATGGVWRGVEAITPAVAPDLPGHGSAAWHETYSFTGHAEAVLPLLEAFDRPVPVVGHSMGGVVALELAALAPDRVSRVVGLGIKVDWPPEDAARALAMAQRPVATYDTRAEAVVRFLRVSGLAGLAAPDDPMVESAVVDREAAGEGVGGGSRRTPAPSGSGCPTWRGCCQPWRARWCSRAASTTRWSPTSSSRSWRATRSRCPVWATTRTSRPPQPCSHS